MMPNKEILTRTTPRRLPLICPKEKFGVNHYVYNWYAAVPRHRQRAARLGIAVLLANQLLWLPLAKAAQFEITTDPGKTCSAITMKGFIAAPDVGKLRQAMQDAAGRAPLRRIYLNSPGGEFLAATAMWQLIRDLPQPVQTVVPVSAQCSSGCVLLLAAGDQASVSGTATILVHAAQDSLTKTPSRFATLAYGSYLVESGLSGRAMRTMAELRPGQELLITPSNAQKYGFGKFGFFGGSAPPPLENCTWKGFRPKARK